MKITNNFNLPEPFFNVLSRGKYPPVPGRYSVGDLTNPPRIRLLRTRYWNEITEDVSDKLWMLLGSAVHYILEYGAPKESLPEEKMVIKYGEYTLVGIPDLFNNGEISDYKVTSVWSFLLGEKKEWTKALNIYRWMYEQMGFKVNKLTIYAILRDWVKSKSYDRDYPNIPFQAVDIPFMDNIANYISDRVFAHAQAELTGNSFCTNEEKWLRPTKYAVMKMGNKKATKLCDTKIEALNYIGDKDLIIEERKGEASRCRNYCPVRMFCDQNPYREEDNEEQKENDV